MKTIQFVAAIAAAFSAFSFAGAAYAAPVSADASAGHYEWRQTPGYGPRAPLAAPRAVWVSDNPRTASRACDMMRMNPADCMKAMPGMASPASTASAG